MQRFTLNGTTHHFLEPNGFEDPKEVRSWEYGHYPKVLAAVPLTGGGTANVLGESTRWTHTHVGVLWWDHAGKICWAWIPKENVRPASDTEWDNHESRGRSTQNRPSTEIYDCHESSQRPKTGCAAIQR
jgi:hypothetical protein